MKRNQKFKAKRRLSETWGQCCGVEIIFDKNWQKFCATLAKNTPILMPKFALILNLNLIKIELVFLEKRQFVSQKIGQNRRN
jgi:hypothetical protein